jgi:pimeloyl-ACP methyl ester carboxylesterase
MRRSGDVSTKPRITCIAWLLLTLLSWTSGALAQVGLEREGIAGTERHRIDEPVFGGHIVVYEAGRGPSVLLVHGIGAGGARDYRGQIEWLKKSFHVVALDLPGFGASDKGNLLYSPGNYAGVLKRVADRFLERPFILVGHSMGAVVSLRYAATFPDDVDRLVVIDAPGILHRVASASQFLAYLGVEFVPPAIEPMEEIANLARRFLAPLARLRLDPQIILASAQLRETLLGGDPAKISGLAAVSEDLRAALPRVAAPTLLVWGAKDALAPPRNGRVLALKLPHAQLQVIEGAGHTPMIETPGRFRATLEPFLELGLPPPQAINRPLEKRGRGRCLKEDNRVFQGDYESLTIEACDRIRIRNARVRELRIVDSSVTIDDSRVGGGKAGLYARGSTVVMTGGRIEGDVAILANGSRLDLAAVTVEGRRAAVEAEEGGDQGTAASKRSSVVFSLSRVGSPLTRGELHDFYSITPDNPL